MKFAGPCFQHQLYRPGLGFCVLMSSFCHLATHQVWYHWTTSPCFWAVTSQTVSLDGGNKKGLNADANTSHFHVFLWKKKDRLFWVKKQKTISFCWLILPPFCWCRSGSILGASTWVWLPLLSWLCWKQLLSKPFVWNNALRGDLIYTRQNARLCLKLGWSLWSDQYFPGNPSGLRRVHPRTNSRQPVFSPTAVWWVRLKFVYIAKSSGCQAQRGHAHVQKKYAIATLETSSSSYCTTY